MTSARTPTTRRGGGQRKRGRRDEPKLELGETSDEGLELVVLAEREGVVLGIFGRRGLKQLALLGIDLGREEADQLVEPEDTESVGDDVEALEQVDAQHIQQEEDEEAEPSFVLVRRAIVQKPSVSCLGRVSKLLPEAHRGR